MDNFQYAPTLPRHNGSNGIAPEFKFPRQDEIYPVIYRDEGRGRHIGQSEITAICRERSLLEKEEKNTLFKERSRLAALVASRASHRGDSNVAPGSAAGGSATLSGDGGGQDVECFALQGEFETGNYYASSNEKGEAERARRVRPCSSLSINTDEIAAVTSWDGTVHFHDLANNRDLGKHVLVPPGNSSSSTASGDRSSHAFVASAFLRDFPDHLGLASGSVVNLWQVGFGAADGPTKTCVGTFDHESHISKIAFHAQQAVVGTSADDDSLKIWDVKRPGGPPLRKLNNQAQQGNLVDCGFLGEGLVHSHIQFLVAAAGLDGLTTVWDLRRPSLVCSLQGSDASTCLHSHEESLYLGVGCADGNVCLWDYRTWRLQRLLNILTVDKPYARPSSIGFSPCGSFLAAGCLEGELTIFQIERNYRAFRIRHHSDAIAAIAWCRRPTWVFAPVGGVRGDGGLLATASFDGSWTCWAHSGSAYDGARRIE